MTGRIDWPLLINLILLQGFLVIISACWYYYSSDDSILPVFYLYSKVLMTYIPLASLIILVITIKIVYSIIGIYKKSLAKSKLEIKTSANKDLVNFIRGNRHDFMNHFQVIQGLAQLQKPERITDYIKRISDEQKSSIKITRMAHPVIASTILKWANEADKNNVRVNLKIDTKMSDFRGNSSKIAGMLERVLQESVQQLKEIPLGSRKLEIKISEELHYFNLTIGLTTKVEAEKLAEIFSRDLDAEILPYINKYIWKNIELDYKKLEVEIAKSL